MFALKHCLQAYNRQYVDDLKVFKPFRVKTTSHEVRRIKEWVAQSAKLGFWPALSSLRTRADPHEMKVCWIVVSVSSFTRRNTVHNDVELVGETQEHERARDTHVPSHRSCLSSSACSTQMHFSLQDNSTMTSVMQLHSEINDNILCLMAGGT